MGTPQQRVGDIKRYEELGVRHLLVHLQYGECFQSLCLCSS